MKKPNRHNSHVVNTKGEKHLESKLPDEWYFSIPKTDYGIDYQVEISVNGEVTGYNFSIQLKSISKGGNGPIAKTTLKHSTLSYYQVRLEPVMVVVYEADKKEAYWTWVSDLNIDLSKENKTYTINIPKANTLANANWSQITKHVQQIFNNRTFISDFDISKIHNNLELAAWKVYNGADYEQAVYLFRHLLQVGINYYNVQQALAWSLYRSFRFSDALSIINDLINLNSSDSLLQVKACILAEYGFSDGDKGKIIQAKNLFKKSLDAKATAMVYYNYANTLSGLNNFDEAIEQYKVSLQKDPNFAECWKNLGDAYGHIGQIQDELKCYNTALLINPHLQPAIFSKAVVLTKDFNQYHEAIQLFNQVLTIPNNLTKSYINGFYWVALAYEKTGNLTSALYWIDYGLSFSGTNPYFLNFKSDLLASNWKQKPELKIRAKDFFEYRIELNNDFKSIYYLIKLEGWSLDEAYLLLQKHTQLYSKTSLTKLKSIGFSLDMVLVTLLELDIYCKIKKTHEITRYTQHLASPYYSITGDIWDLMEIIFAYCCSQSIEHFYRHQKPEILSAEIFTILSELMPNLVPMIVQEKTRAKEEINEIFGSLFSGLQTIIFREVGAQTGYIQVNLKLENIETEKYITNDLKEKLQERLYFALTKRLQLNREEGV
jgi:tetratricopeptide (TPR) repeat protein